MRDRMRVLLLWFLLSLVAGVSRGELDDDSGEAVLSSSTTGAWDGSVPYASFPQRHHSCGTLILHSFLVLRGIPSPGIAKIESMLKPDPKGLVGMDQLARAGDALGLRLVGVRCREGALPVGDRPCIACLQYPNRLPHYVLVVKTTPGTVFFYNPPEPLAYMSRADFGDACKAIFLVEKGAMTLSDKRVVALAAVLSGLGMVLLIVRRVRRRDAQGFLGRV